MKKTENQYQSIQKNQISFVAFTIFPRSMYDYYSSKMHEWLAFILTFPEKKSSQSVQHRVSVKKKKSNFQECIFANKISVPGS